MILRDEKCEGGLVVELVSNGGIVSPKGCGLEKRGSTTAYDFIILLRDGGGREATRRRTIIPRVVLPSGVWCVGRVVVVLFLNY